MRTITFLGSSLEDLKSFNVGAMSMAGYQLYKVQSGEEPTNWKPMPSIGAGVKEIRIKSGNAYRVIYLAKHEDTVYVLHAFNKKTQKTPKQDIELAKARLQEIK